ncbi:uncharacterized protein STEHIDRAFT_116871, partial [Stereum hirsutum FP-91666 SS1]
MAIKTCSTRSTRTDKCISLSVVPHIEPPLHLDFNLWTHPAQLAFVLHAERHTTRTNPSAFVSSADCVVMCFAESKTRSGRGYSAWDTATAIKVDIDATSLLQRAVESERTRQYDEDASPEFSPALTPTRTSNARKNLDKRAKEKKKKTSTRPADILKGRKIRRGTANNYANPRVINVNFVVTALTMARYADVGKNRPAGPSVPTLEEIRRDHPDFTLITNPEL